MTVWPSGVATPLHGAVIQTYDDHRMAMSLALAGLRVTGVAIADPGCVAKTFPAYWRQLATLTGFPDPGSG
jgi:3-phosphoshikimate 1-carboxyvinyltransferase